MTYIVVSVTMREMLEAAARSTSRSLHSPPQARSLMAFIWYSREGPVLTKLTLSSIDVRIRRRKGENNPLEVIAG